MSAELLYQAFCVLLNIGAVVWAVWMVKDIVLPRRRQPGRHQQTTFCYCPKCKAELCSTAELVEDTDLVRYRCTRCQHRSGWLFDAPVPLLIEGKP